jgi:ribosomal protein S18 acetylase RimI-like enzyme
MSIEAQVARYRIAPAESCDFEDVARLFKAYESHIGVDLSYQGFASELSTLPGKYAPPGGQLLIARDAHQNAIGCVALRPLDERCCEMKRLFVAPAGRGLGLGRALASAIVDEAKRLGYAEMRLDTLPSMQTAIGLYKELGFVAIDPYYATALPGTLFMARTFG